VLEEKHTTTQGFIITHRHITVIQSFIHASIGNNGAAERAIADTPHHPASRKSPGMNDQSQKKAREMRSLVREQKQMQHAIVMKPRIPNHHPQPT
jgi:hypothetical protein